MLTVRAADKAFGAPPVRCRVPLYLIRQEAQPGRQRGAATRTAQGIASDAGESKGRSDAQHCSGLDW